jgi:hypothetical protein
MNLQSLEYRAKEPNVLHRSCGDWLATTPKDSGLVIGVTAPTEEDVREKFGWTVKRWVEILGMTMKEAAN